MSFGFDPVSSYNFLFGNGTSTPPPDGSTGDSGFSLTGMIGKTFGEIGQTAGLDFSTLFSGEPGAVDSAAGMMGDLGGFINGTFSDIGATAGIDLGDVFGDPGAALDSMM